MHQQAETAVLQLLPSVDMNPVGVEGLRIFLLLNELLHACIQKCRWQQSKKLADAVAATMQRLPNESIQILGTVTPTILLTGCPDFSAVLTSTSFYPTPTVLKAVNAFLITQSHLCKKH